MFPDASSDWAHPMLSDQPELVTMICLAQLRQLSGLAHLQKFFAFSIFWHLDFKSASEIFISYIPVLHRLLE